MRPEGILRLRREPANDGVADVLRTELGVFFRGGGILGPNGVLESGRLEGGLPVHDPLLQVRPPLLGRRRIEIVEGM